MIPKENKQKEERGRRTADSRHTIGRRETTRIMERKSERKDRKEGRKTQRSK